MCAGTTVPPHGGQRLGLSIAQSLVQLMGGTFRLSIDADLFRADVTLPLVQQS